MKKLTYKNLKSNVNPTGNWVTARDFFPELRVDQKKRHVDILSFYSVGFQKKAKIFTNMQDVKVSKKGDAMFVRGEVDCQNWVNRKCSGTQKFCFALFVGDSGHIYTHRAPASKGWMEASPEKITARLRKLGIGVEKVAFQQGDFLLKNANSKGYPDSEFKHETQGAGHHKFVAPVLYADGSAGRQYLITEPVLLVHQVTDIQHPDVLITPGKYIVGTTAMSLSTQNKRD